MFYIKNFPAILTKIVLIALAITPSLTIANTTSAEDAVIDKQIEVVAFLDQAANYIEKQGKKAALDEFNKPDGKFTNGSSYIFSETYDGLITANVNRPDTVGKNLLNKTNFKNEYVIRNFIKLAKDGRGGWYRYHEINPETHQVECKNSYILPMDGYLIGTGYYYKPKLKNHC